MAFIFNERSIGAEPIAKNAARQQLLTASRIAGTCIRLDRYALGADATVQLDVPAANVAWLQILEGAAQLQHAQGAQALSPAHIAFLPPGFTGAIASPAGATLLYAEIADAGRYDPGFAKNPPRMRVVDWMREPVLDSEHDARKRIYLVTPRLFGTRALKGEMVIYPPGTQASNHHHEGAEHFMYLLKGRATAHINEQPTQVSAGDVIYFHDRERHYFSNETDEDMVFVEFFAPGDYRTMWAPESAICTWVPTGRDIRGEKPARDIRKHVLPTPDV
jgi:quercetin dioxygenase-like cupin family protein